MSKDAGCELRILHFQENFCKKLQSVLHHLATLAKQRDMQKRTSDKNLGSTAKEQDQNRRIPPVDEFEERIRETDVLQTTLRENEAVISDLRERIKQLSMISGVGIDDIEYRFQCSACTDLQERIKELQISLRQKDTKINDLYSGGIAQCSECAITINSLQTDRQHIRAQLHSSTDRTNLLEQRVNEMVPEIESLQSTNEALKARLKISNDRNTEMIPKIENLQQRIQNEQILNSELVGNHSFALKIERDTINRLESKCSGIQGQYNDLMYYSCGAGLVMMLLWLFLLALFCRMSKAMGSRFRSDDQRNTKDVRNTGNARAKLEEVLDHSPSSGLDISYDQPRNPVREIMVAHPQGMEMKEMERVHSEESSHNGKAIGNIKTRRSDQITRQPDRGCSIFSEICEELVDANKGLYLSEDNSRNVLAE